MGRYDREGFTSDLPQDIEDSLQSAFSIAWEELERTMQCDRIVLVAEGHLPGAIQMVFMTRGNPRINAKMLREAADVIEEKQIGREEQLLPRKPGLGPEDPEVE